MGNFIIKLSKLEDIKKNKFKSDINIVLNSHLLFYIEETQKIYGIYQSVKRIKGADYWEISFSPLIKFRRGIDAILLKQTDIKIPSAKYIYRIKKSHYEKIYQYLNEINFPQLASDLLWFNLRQNKCQLNYFQTYPEIKMLSETISIDIKHIKQIIRTAEMELKKQDNLKKCGLKIFSLFNKFKILHYIKARRDIAMLIDENISLLPFEILFDGEKFWAEKYNLSRIFFTNPSLDSINSLIHYDNEVLIVAPKYKNSISFNFNRVYKLFNLKTKKLIVYNKKLKPEEFARICDTSKILYYTGHTVFNKRKKDYGLKLSDTDYFYLKDFLQYIKLPELIIFHCCFENKYFSVAEGYLKDFFNRGVKNVLIPFIEIPQKDGMFMYNFIQNLVQGNKIGECFRAGVKIGMLKNDNDWVYYRLFGDPKLKYF